MHVLHVPSYTKVTYIIPICGLLVVPQTPFHVDFLERSVFFETRKRLV